MTTPRARIPVSSSSPAAMAEPFPLLNTSADQLHHADTDRSFVRRHKSSGLGNGIRVGDTGAPALAKSSASLGEPASPMSPTSPALPNGHTKRFSRRRRARGVVSRVRQIMVRHIFVLPACILLAFLSGYAVNPSESNPLHGWIFLSYRLPYDDVSRPVQYGKGPRDMAFVAFYTVVLSFTREFIMQELLRPLARRTGLGRAKQARFMEQMYTALYFGILGPMGMFVMSRTPVWYFNTRGMYANFPHRSHEAVVKFYYLFQAAYWAQQAIVLLLGIEKPRKDFKELVGHHIVSLALIGLSYRFHFTYLGLAVYTTHDISDFFLATSKVLNYMDHPAVGPYFFLFMCVWIYLRHVVNLRIIWTLFTDFRNVGPFELDWAAEQYKCWISQYLTVALLSSLQALNLFWLFYIVRIAYRFVMHNVAEDDRSDDEGDDGAADADEQSPAAQQQCRRKLAGKSSKYVPVLEINGQAVIDASLR